MFGAIEKEEFYIIGIDIRDFGPIKAIVIKDIPKDGYFEIAGHNEAGKSHVMDAVACALGGGSMKIEKPIRVGQEKAVIDIKLQGKDHVYNIVKKFVGDNAYLEIRDERGMKFDQGPQQWLDDMCGGPMMFDPTHILRMPNDEMVKFIERVCGLDISKFNTAIDEAFEAQSVANKAKKDAEGHLTTLQNVEHPGKLKSIQSIIDARNVAASKNLDAAEFNNLRANKIQEYKDYDDEIKNIKDEIKRRKEAFEEAKEILTERVMARTKLKEELQQKYENSMGFVETDIFDAQIVESQKQEKRLAVWTTYSAAKEIVSRRTKEAETAKATLATKREDLQKYIGSQKLPIENMTISDGNIEIGEIPLSQMASSRKIRIATKLFLHSNPALQSILIRDTNILDSNSREELKEIQRKYGFQIFCELVIEKGDEEKSTSFITIEDGLQYGVPVPDPRPSRRGRKSKNVEGGAEAAPEMKSENEQQVEESGPAPSADFFDQE